MLIRSSARLRGASALAAIGATALALGACGGADSGASGAAAADDARDTARLKLQQCLRENGVDLPDNPGQAGGRRLVDVDRDKVQKALQGPCKKLQQAAFGTITAEQRQEMQDAFQKFASCMRDNGVDVPDITAGGGPQQGRARIDADDPKVQAAREKCQGSLPRGGVLRVGPGAR